MSKKSGKGMRRRTFRGGRLHVFGDDEGVVIQLRTESVSSAEDVAATCCKMGVVLSGSEALEVAAELVTLCSKQMKGKS